MVKQKEIALCVIFSIITCGIYGLYWFVCLTDDVNELSGDYATPGILALVLNLVTCGIYGLYWAYKLGDRLDTIKQKKGIIASNGGVLYLIVYIFAGIITFALIQNEINKLTT